MADHEPDGKFAKGNQINRRSGLYIRTGLSWSEQKRMSRLRKLIESQGVPRDASGEMALVHFNASRVLESLTKLSDAELVEKFDLFDRASRLMLGVVRRRGQATEQDEQESLADRIERERRGATD